MTTWSNCSSNTSG